MKQKTFTLLVISLLLLALPSLKYALNTEFVLVDDMFCWTLNGLNPSDWFFTNFLSFDYERFRPAWEMQEFIAWNAFKSSSFLHHALRLLFKAGIVFFVFKILNVLFSESKPAKRLSFFIFASFFVFCPISPETRLAPQEPILVFYFCVLSYLLVKDVVLYRSVV